MQRRHFISHTSALAASAVLPSRLKAQVMRKVQNLSQAWLWLDQLEAAPDVKTSGMWPLSTVLQHLAQSIEMSMDGFPHFRSALFQSTVGAAAFTVFKLRGQMSPCLAEPIPGAPVLASSLAWRPAAIRLRSSITRFNAHSTPLKPHFAYGALSKSDYTIAHRLHIANHQDEILIHQMA